MTLAERLSELVRAAFSGLYIQSFEHDDALAEIAALCRRENWSLATWDVDRGLALVGQEAPAGVVPGTADPLAAFRSLGALATPDGTALLVLRNFHRYLGSAEIVQALDTRVVAGRQDRTFVVILAPVVQLPVELERQFVVVEHDLPGRAQLERIARGVAVEPGELPEGDGLDAVLDAAAGLTRVEAENAFSLSVVRHGRLAPDVLWDLKGRALKKAGLLTLHRGGESFADLGGLETLKGFCTRALRPGRPGGVRARGLLLLGVPGTGKSAFAKALGNETGRPTLVLDVGALMGSLVGETERRVREALRAVDAMAPCVVVVDELEKALGGAAWIGGRRRPPGARGDGPGSWSDRSHRRGRGRSPGDLRALSVAHPSPPGSGEGWGAAARACGPGPVTPGVGGRWAAAPRAGSGGQVVGRGGRAGGRRSAVVVEHGAPRDSGSRRC